MLRRATDRTSTAAAAMITATNQSIDLYSVYPVFNQSTSVWALEFS
jgi:hypothetical protein